MTKISESTVNIVMVSPCAGLGEELGAGRESHRGQWMSVNCDGRCTESQRPCFTFKVM